MNLGAYEWEWEVWAPWFENGPEVWGGGEVVIVDA
jgi:hypothetical protein